MLRRRSEEFEAAEDKRLSRIYKTLEMQVWDLLPGCCTGAVDVPANLKVRSLRLTVAMVTVAAVCLRRCAESGLCCLPSRTF